MRRFIDIISEQQDSVADLIAKANFSVEECDDINHGECGTFAVALFTLLQERGIPSRIGVLVRSDSDDRTKFGDHQSLYWGHMFVEHAGLFYDADGQVTLADMIGNYMSGFVEAGYEVLPIFFDDLTDLYHNVRAKDVVNDAVLPRLKQRLYQ